MFSIGALSREAGVKVPTIRYYEQMGLIDAPARSQGNQRRYSARDAERLAFIRHARDMGLPLETIRELLRLSSAPEYPCADADRIVRQHLQAIRQRITKLRRLEQELARMAEGCESERVRDCYVLQSLADHALCAEEH
jgi:DNA-binding transcriptional MerR regulator